MKTLLNWWNHLRGVITVPNTPEVDDEYNERQERIAEIWWRSKAAGKPAVHNRYW